MRHRFGLLVNKLSEYDHNKLKAKKLTLRRPSHMQQLYRVCRAKRKVWKAICNGSHNDTVAEPYFFDYFLEFIREVS